MAETAKRNTNSANKSRKSKNDIIRSALGMYLKQRNYSGIEKYRKSDLALTQNTKQMQFSMMLDEDISKVNSFLYSNVLCLSKNATIVDQQFTKFLNFVQSQLGTNKNELQIILNPLYCHLYIEILKGGDAKTAQDFLKKYAHIIGPVDSLSSPLTNKINGCAVPANVNDDPLAPSGTTQITFVPDAENEQTTQEYFKELVKSMSLCKRIEELDAMEITRNFRCAKYEMELSLSTLYALKTFLVQNGHVVILQLLKSWFSFEITDANDEHYINEDESFTDDIMDCVEIVDSPTIVPNARADLYTKVKSELGVQIKENKITASTSTSTNADTETETFSNKERINYKLKNIRTAVLQMKQHEQPVKVFNIANGNNILTAADIDTNECHLSCGFNNSSIKIWQIQRSSFRGRKPYSFHANRTCEWNENHHYCNSSSEDEEDENKSELHSTLLDEKTSPSNVFSSSSGIILRGHSKGVTDVLFSRYNPILMSVSKDTTMRAWRSTNYTCGAVYRGHNYPIWCVTESPVGLYFATGSKDLTARLWISDREYPLQTYIGHTQDVCTIAFHPNGNYLATGSTDSTVRLWCVTSGKLFRVFTDCHNPVQTISFSPDGKYLAAAGEETKIRIFDLAGGSQLTELKDHSAPVTSIAWNTPGNKIASCCIDGTVRAFNVNKLNVSVPTTPFNSTTSNKLALAYSTGCKRCVKTFFNPNGTVSCIGNT